MSQQPPKNPTPTPTLPELAPRPLDRPRQVAQPPAKKAEPKPPPPPPLELYVEVGDVVNWYPQADANEPAQLAVVSGIGINSITANVISPYMRDTLPQNGCRHVSDPRARIDGEGGGWAHRSQTVLIRRMLMALGVLIFDKDNRLVVPRTADAIIGGMSEVIAKMQEAGDPKPADPPAAQVTTPKPQA